MMKPSIAFLALMVMGGTVQGRPTPDPYIHLSEHLIEADKELEKADMDVAKAEQHMAEVEAKIAKALMLTGCSLLLLPLGVFIVVRRW